MTQETFNYVSIALQVVGIIVSGVVAAVVWWYTVETQKIRKTGERQLQLSLAPYLNAFIENYIAEGGINPRTRVADPRPAFSCRINNPVDRPAHYVHVLVYNGVDYFWSDETIDVLGKTTTDLGRSIAARRLNSHQDAIHAMDREYKAEWKRYSSNVVKQNRGFLAVFFRDVNSNVYVAKRNVDFDGNRTNAVAHWENRILRPFGD